MEEICRRYQEVDSEVPLKMTLSYEPNQLEFLRDRFKMLAVNVLTSFNTLENDWPEGRANINRAVNVIKNFNDAVRGYNPKLKTE